MFIHRKFEDMNKKEQNTKFTKCLFIKFLSTKRKEQNMNMNIKEPYEIKFYKH